MLTAVATFSLAAVLLVLLPGPDTMIILRSIVRGGRRSGFATVLGIQTGLAVWVVAAVLGLSALLRASETAYDILRVAGACYLVYLGVQSLRRSTGGTTDVTGTAAAPPRSLMGTGYTGGLVCNLLNPKVGVFFVTFLPGFVPHGHAVGPTTLLFGAIFILINLAYQLPLVGMASRLSGLLARPRFRRRLEIATGAVLVGFGVRLAVES